MGKRKGLALQHPETVFTAGAVGSRPDALLLERFLAGPGNAESSSAFAALLERHGPMVLGVCHDVLRPYPDAEDMEPAPMTFTDIAAGEDGLGDVTVTVRENPARNDRHECCMGWVGEDGDKVR
jgi:hypothetical protein